MDVRQQWADIVNQSEVPVVEHQRSLTDNKIWRMLQSAVNVGTTIMFA